jgi:hypothetical protein
MRDLSLWVGLALAFTGVGFALLFVPGVDAEVALGVMIAGVVMAVLSLREGR